MKNNLEDIIDDLANDIMLEFNDEDKKEFLNLEQELEEKFAKVTNINTDGVEPLFFPFELTNSHLREDDQFEVLEKDDVLRNAPSISGDYISIVKVVNKNEV